MWMSCCLHDCLLKTEDLLTNLHKEDLWDLFDSDSLSLNLTASDV